MLSGVLAMALRSTGAAGGEGGGGGGAPEDDDDDDDDGPPGPAPRRFAGGGRFSLLVVARGVPVVDSQALGLDDP